jgi:hypothetical protein
MKIRKINAINKKTIAPEFYNWNFKTVQKLKKASGTAFWAVR